jgi:hypothetical protein
MNQRIFCFLISLCAVVRLEASMVRVLDVLDGQTLVVERRGVAETVKLAGIAITDDDGARALMTWTLVSSWVMLDEQPEGGHFVYRSPDALFVNRELVSRGFAHATLPSIEPTQHVIVTYLGTSIDPGVSAARRRSEALLAGAATSRAARGTSSAPTPRSRGSRSRPRRGSLP